MIRDDRELAAAIFLARPGPEGGDYHTHLHAGLS